VWRRTHTNWILESDVKTFKEHGNSEGEDTIARKGMMRLLGVQKLLNGSATTVEISGVNDDFTVNFL
jgi:hypothetical protein